MATIRNRVRLIGNAGNDPEVKRLDGGKIVANLSLATSEKFTNGEGETVTDTQWHHLVFWGKTAEIVEKYVTKGKQIAVEGKLTYREYENSHGEKKLTVEIVIDDLLLL